LWCEEEIRLQEHLPQWYAGIREAALIQQGAQTELENFRVTLHDGLRTICTLALEPTVLEIYRRMFQLEPQSHPEKQMDIIRSCFQSRLPINQNRVEQVGMTLMGENSQLRLDIDREKYICHAKYKADMSQNREETIYAKLRAMIPANMILSLAYDYVEWGQIQHITWQQAATLTWDGLRQQGDSL
jgi:hypothetical protein